MSTGEFPDFGTDQWNANFIATHRNDVHDTKINSTSIVKTNGSMFNGDWCLSSV